MGNKIDANHILYIFAVDNKNIIKYSKVIGIKL